jgi:hypothetical protein
MKFLLRLFRERIDLAIIRNTPQEEKNIRYLVQLKIMFGLQVKEEARSSKKKLIFI